MHWNAVSDPVFANHRTATSASLIEAISEGFQINTKWYILVVILWTALGNTLQTATATLVYRPKNEIGSYGEYGGGGTLATLTAVTDLVVLLEPTPVPMGRIVWLCRSGAGWLIGQAPGWLLGRPRCWLADRVVPCCRGWTVDCAAGACWLGRGEGWLSGRAR
jgi:hypothetical protein